MMNNRFTGKYRGRVENNEDPMQLGRVRVSVPSVFGQEQNPWAMPSVPYAGPNVGFFFIPPVGANVWVEFEAGNKDYPIWTGCFWNAGDVPANPAIPDTKIIRTESASITLQDQQGSGNLIIETIAGMRISIGSTGIQIDDGKGGNITISGPKVTINNGALEIE
jgi:uncharacterized protein involved in type VI secretion and phage assembly